MACIHCRRSTFGFSTLRALTLTNTCTHSRLSSPICIVSSYLIAVLVFAVLFILAGVVNGDGGNGHQSFEDAFLLSLQSFSTIGYGVLSPETRWGHAVVFFQSIFSMIFTGVVSGAIFFKFILPHCRIRYASNVVIYKRPSDGKRVMQLRSVSAPGCYLLNTVVKLEVAMWVLDHKGRTTGERLFPLKLTMDHFIIGLTAGTYTHVIDDESPLRNMTEDTCAKVFKHMTFGLVGTESHTSMTCTSAKIYSAADVVFGKKYADFFSVVDGKAEVDGTRLNLLADLPISDGSDDANSKSMPAIRRLVETMIRATSDGKEPPPNATVVGDGGGKKPEFFEKAVHAENVPPKRSESFAFV